MGIDKVIVLSLARSENRQWATLGSLAAMQTPISCVQFIKGHDNLDFDNDSKQIAEAAAADGFPFVSQFARMLGNDFAQQTAASACQVWNYARILRHIAKGIETCLILWDDRTLTLPFPFVDKITRELQRRKDFHIWQLRIRFNIGRLILNSKGKYLNPDTQTHWERTAGGYPELIDSVRDTQDLLSFIDEDEDVFAEKCKSEWLANYTAFLEDHYQSNKMNTPISEYVDKHLQKGLIGLDETNVFSPKGAAWLLLELLKITNWDDPEYIEILKECRFSKQMKTLYPDWNNARTIKNTFTAIDAWMYNVLDFESVVSAGAGIYCPKRLEYAYINEPLPMGSDVDWAAREDWEKLRILSTDIPLLDIP